jgi:hypothetical protein
MGRELRYPHLLLTSTPALLPAMHHANYISQQVIHPAGETRRFYFNCDLE